MMISMENDANYSSVLDDANALNSQISLLHDDDMDCLVNLDYFPITALDSISEVGCVRNNNSILSLNQ